MSEEFKSNKNENKVNSDEMQQEQPSNSSPQCFNAQQTTLRLINDYNELTKVHAMRMTQIEAEEIVEDVLKQAINSACDILEAGISWEKILKSTPQKRFMMGHTLKSSPILREPEPDFGDSTAPFQDNIFKIIFNLQVMGCLPHHFDNLQSNNPQFQLQDNEQSIPSVIITEEKSSENSIKKKISNKSRIPRHTPVSNEFNSKQQGSSSENVPHTPSEESIVSDNEHMTYNDNGLPELLDSLEIPHCSYKKYKELKNNCAKECNENSNYSGNQNTNVDREDLNNSLVTNKGLIPLNEETYEFDNYKMNKNTGSRNIKAPAFTVKQCSIHENACSKTEKSSFESRKIKTELHKSSFNEDIEDVSNDLKVTLQENFDTSQVYESEVVNNSHNWTNFSGFHENMNSFVQIKALKNMTDGKAIETVLNDSTESHISQGANEHSYEQNSERRENPISYAVSTKLEVNEKHNEELVSDHETVNNECVSSNDQHIVRKLEAQLNKFDPGISVRLLSNSQILNPKQDLVTHTSYTSNDQSYQKLIYKQPIEITSLPRKSENTNILNNDNIHRNHSACEINDFNYLNDSNSNNNSMIISENAFILQDKLDKDVCDNLKPLSSICNKCDEDYNNTINNDKNSHEHNFECNIPIITLRDQINVDEILEIKPLSSISNKCDENDYNYDKNSHENNFECNIVKVNSRDQINVDDILEINDDLKPFSSFSNKCDENDYNKINSDENSHYDNFECNILKANLRDQINMNEKLEIKQYCYNICKEILNHVLENHTDNKNLNNEVLSNDHYRCDVDETITENFNEIFAANVSNYFKDIVDDANKNIINDIKEFVHELKTLQNTLDQHEQQSIQANEMEDKLKDLQNIFNSDHESESDEQIATICDIKPSISSLKKTGILENTSQQNLNEETNSHSSNISIPIVDHENCYNLNKNFDFITYGVWEDTQKDVTNKNVEVKDSLKNDLEESPFILHTNFINTNEGSILEQGHTKNSYEKVVQNESFNSANGNVMRKNIKNVLEHKFDIETQDYLTSESANDINNLYSHEKNEKSNDAEQELLNNYETKNINQYSQLNDIENYHQTEDECYSSMQRESEVMGLLQNRLILTENLNSISEKTDEAEKIENRNLKHEIIQEISDSQYLDFDKFKGNNRKKWDIKSDDETVFNAFENVDDEKPIIDVESNDSVGYYFNNNELCDNTILQNRTLNDQISCSLFESIFENNNVEINSNSFNETQENNISERLDSFKLQNASNYSQESETDEVQFSNLNPTSYPIEIDSHKCFTDKEEWGEIQSYDYLEFIIDRINIKTSLMEHKQTDNMQIEFVNNNSTSDTTTKSKLKQESNQYTEKESEKETSKYFDYCLKKSDIALKVDEHTTDYSQEMRYDSESHTENISQTITSSIVFIPDKESENRNFKCENDSSVSLQNLGTNVDILDKDVDTLSISEKDTKSRFKHFEVSKVSEDLQKESGLWTERNLSSPSESQSFHDLGTLHNSSVYKSNSVDIENINNDIEFSGNNSNKTHADLVHSIPNVCQTYYNSNSEGSSQNNILGNLPIAANYINSRFLAAESSECNIAPNNKEVIVTNANARNILKPEKNNNTSQKQSFDMFWEYDGYYSKSYNEDFEAHKTSEDTSDEKYKFYKEIFEKMIEEIGDIEKEQSSDDIKEELQSNLDVNKVKEPETHAQNMNCAPSNEKFKRGHGNLDVYSRNSSDKFSGSKVYWSSVGLVVENNDDPNTLPCCEQSDENFETFMEEAESGCVDLIYAEEDKKNLGVEDNFGSTSDTAVNSNIDFILNKDTLQHVNKQDNCDELGEQVTMKVRKKNKFIQRIRSFFSSNIKVGAKVKKTRGDK